MSGYGSSPHNRQDCYTNRQPDGTVVTATSRIQTKYVEDVEDNVYNCSPGTINQKFCFQLSGILKITEIVS